jgi:hypothetical protein
VELPPPLAPPHSADVPAAPPDTDEPSPPIGLLLLEGAPPVIADADAAIDAPAPPDTLAVVPPRPPPPANADR